MIEYLYFEPFEVVEAVREIGKISNFMDLSIKCKTHEETAFVFAQGVAHIDYITNINLRNVVNNLFADYLRTNETNLYPLIIYYKLYDQNDKAYAKNVIAALYSRLAAQDCGIKAFEQILASEKDADGRFKIKKEDFESNSAISYYPITLTEKTLSHIKKLYEQDGGILAGTLIQSSQYEVQFAPKLLSKIREYGEKYRYSEYDHVEKKMK